MQQESQPVRIVPQPIRPVMREEEVNTSFQKKSLSSPQPMQQQRASDDDVDSLDEDEVDIPAFIRKKMNVGGN
jgi:hypothetical protein